MNTDRRNRTKGWLIMIIFIPRKEIILSDTPSLEQWEKINVTQWTTVARRQHGNVKQPIFRARF